MVERVAEVEDAKSCRRRWWPWRRRWLLRGGEATRRRPEARHRALTPTAIGPSARERLACGARSPLEREGVRAKVRGHSRASRPTKTRDKGPVPASPVYPPGLCLYNTTVSLSVAAAHAHTAHAHHTARPRSALPTSQRVTVRTRGDSTMFTTARPAQTHCPRLRASPAARAATLLAASQSVLGAHDTATGRAHGARRSRA